MWSLRLLENSCISTPCSIPWDNSCFPLSNLVNLLKRCITSYHPDKIYSSLNSYNFTVISLAPGPGYEVLVSVQRRNSLWTGEGPAALPHFCAHSFWKQNNTHTPKGRIFRERISAGSISDFFLILALTVLQVVLVYKRTHQVNTVQHPIVCRQPLSSSILGFSN